jgi:predicted RNA-binding protein with PUA-like domain
VKGHWLVKSDPGTFSISDLEKSKNRTTSWDGVRNYQARNFLRAMKKGERALFYHSNADPSGVVGVVEVAREAYLDPTDESATWSAVDLRHVRTFPRVVELEELKATRGLEKMTVVQKGTRLSVTPVTPEEFALVLDLAGR